MELALQSVSKHFERAISNVHHIQRPPLTEDAKRLIERILADEGTQMKTGYRAALMAMCEAS